MKNPQVDDFKNVDECIDYILDAFKQDPDYKLIESVINLAVYPGSKNDKLFDLQQTCDVIVIDILNEKVERWKKRHKEYKQKAKATALCAELLDCVF